MPQGGPFSAQAAPSESRKGLPPAPGKPPPAGSPPVGWGEGSTDRAIRSWESTRPERRRGARVVRPRPLNNLHETGRGAATSHKQRTTAHRGPEAMPALRSEDKRSRHRMSRFPTRLGPRLIYGIGYRGGSLTDRGGRPERSCRGRFLLRNHSESPDPTVGRVVCPIGRCALLCQRTRPKSRPERQGEADSERRRPPIQSPPPGRKPQSKAPRSSKPSAWTTRVGPVRPPPGEGKGGFQRNARSWKPSEVALIDAMGETNECLAEARVESFKIKAVHEKDIEADLHLVKPSRHSNRLSMGFGVDQDPPPDDAEGGCPHEQVKEPIGQRGRLEVASHLPWGGIQEVGEALRRKQVGQDHQEKG